MYMYFDDLLNKFNSQVVIGRAYRQFVNHTLINMDISVIHTRFCLHLFTFQLRFFNLNIL